MKTQQIMAFFKNRDYLILMVIIVLGFLLRTHNLNGNFIFAYDQGRDAQRIYDMADSKHLKLVGPETDIQGVFNGPLFYYVLFPSYFISHFNPSAVVLFITIVNLLAIFLIYYFGRLLFNNKVGLLAGFLWSMSYEQANYARYLSNASFMSISVLVFFIGIVLFIFKKRDMGLIISAIGLALSAQFNVYLIYLFLLYPVCYYVFRPHVTKKIMVISIGVLVTLLSPFVLAEIKFNFSAIKALMLYGQKQSEFVDIIQNLSVYSTRLSETLYYSFFSFNNFLAFILFIFFIFLNWKQKGQKNELTFLYLCIFSTLPLFAFKSGVLTVPVINSSLHAVLTIFFALSIYNLVSIKALALSIITIVLVVISNLNLYRHDNFNNVALFLKFPLLYQHETQAIDYMYDTSGNAPFSVCALTNPLFINTLWSYLFSTYGKNTYGRLPYWSGQKQYGRESGMPYDTQHIGTRYLLLEPPIGLPDHALKTTLYLEDKVSVLDEEKKFGDIRVQKRHLEKNSNLLKQTQELTPIELNGINAVIKIDPRYSCFVSY